MNKRIGEKATAGARLRGSNGRFRPRSLPAKKKAPDEKVVADKPLRPAQCRGYLRRELAGSFPAIVRGFVKQAESGSVQHLKLTTELLGEPGTTKRRKSSALTMLETLGQMGTPEATEAVAGADVWEE